MIYFQDGLIDLLSVQCASIKAQHLIEQLILLIFLFKYTLSMVSSLLTIQIYQVTIVQIFVKKQFHEFNAI